MNRVVTFLIAIVWILLCEGEVQAQTQAQTLRWDPVAATDIKEYLVYACDEPTFAECPDSVASVLHPKTTYDTSEFDSQTWFRVTAVDTSGNKSGFSEIIDNRPPPIPLGVRIVTETTQITTTETTTTITKTVE